MLNSYLGSFDFPEIERRIESGDAKARLAVEAMVEQIAAEIASLVPKLKGEWVDQVILTGALIQSALLASDIQTALSALDLEITIYPGDLELEALRDSALRVLRGVEPLRDYEPIRKQL